MRHEIAHLQRPQHVLVFELAVRAQHLGRAEGRDELGHRVDQLATPFLVQGHQRRAHDGLGHRVDTEDAVRRHRHPGFAILPADLGRVHDAVAAHHEGAETTVGTGIDVTLQRGRDVFEAGGIHADVFGGGGGLGHGGVPSAVDEARILAGRRKA